MTSIKLPALLLAVIPFLPAQQDRFGNPACSGSDAIYVFTGPLFESEDTEVIGANHVAVPSHTYKVILAVQADHLTMYAAIVPNSIAAGDLIAAKRM